MSTRCWIGQKREDGIHSFYCHYDGYPDYPHGVGSTLVRFYDSEELATKLIDLCEPYGISSLEKTLKDTAGELYADHAYPNPVYKNNTEYEKNADFDIEYIYLWTKGEWKLFKSGSFRSIKKYCKKALSDN